ncbi:hypothetical protein HSB1_35050 [Halogranum salarium B-1]|uniref:Uncharacterized protein n=1 Tax=Halogranum salarium B-1 TaxID=1210908 RepID=J2ZYJ6_9EURY|nr:hypothetical protein HSB1_35050 [Halogranum salarium B-1]
MSESLSASDASTSDDPSRTLWTCRPTAVSVHPIASTMQTQPLTSTDAPHATNTDQTAVDV